MTITLQAVNELIASLESAGELSIKETKVMALAKAFKQLAAENVALKSAIETHKHGFVRCNCCGDELMCHTDDVCRALDEIPATDRIVAGIKSDGVEDEPFGFVSRSGDLVVIELNGDQRVRDGMPVFVKALSEGADK